MIRVTKQPSQSGALFTANLYRLAVQGMKRICAFGLHWTTRLVSVTYLVYPSDEPMT